MVVQASGDISVQTTAITALNGDAVSLNNGGAGDVDFEAAGPIAATNGNGVFVRDTAAGGDISVTTQSVSAEDATYSGIDILSVSTTRDVTVVANGPVRGGGIGIRAETVGAGTVSVTAGAVTSAAGTGIHAVSDGGSIIVDAGDVTSVEDVGISVRQGEDGLAGSISVDAGNVSGRAGILAINDGTGATLVQAGAVTATGANGLVVNGRGDISVVTGGQVTAASNGLLVRSNTGGTGDISIAGSGGVVALDGHAVRITNNGTGAVSFQNSGPITATNGNGVVVSDTVLGGDISITTGAVTAGTAGYEGIFVASQSTTADISVVVNGDILAGDYGIELSTAPGSAGSIDVTANGSITGGGGIFAEAGGTGSVSVTAVGPITATTGYGIRAAAAGGGDVTVNAGDITSVDLIGIETYAAAGDIDVTAGRVSGTTGIYANNEGDGATVIRTNGAVTGTDDEGVHVEADNSVRLEVGDTVTGATNGAFISAGNGGSGDISNTGAGGFMGLDGDGLSVRNEGSGRVDIDISGAVAATNGYGVYVRNYEADSGDIDVSTGDVTALSPGYDAINVASFSIDGDVSVTASGDVAGYATGISASIFDSSASGDIHVTTNGSVAGDTGIAAVNAGSGAVLVDALGPIAALEDGIVVRSQGGDIVIAAGDVAATGGIGIFAWQQNPAGAGEIDIATTGAVSGDIGILARNDGSGPISVNASGPITAFDAGIYARSHGGDVTIAAGDVAALDDHGICAWQDNAAGAGDVDITTTGAVSGGIAIEAMNDGSGGVSVNASGPITAIDVGIIARSQGGDITITAGTVSSTGDVAVFVEQRNAAGAGDIDITTTGGVSSVLHGIEASNSGFGAIRIAAAGTVNGAGGAGILAEGDAIDVTVAGLVSGNDYGLFLDGGHGGAGDISVTGAGGFSAVDNDAVFIFNAGSGTVTYDVSGPATSTSASGVVVRGTVDGGDISVTTGAVNVLNDGGGITVASDSTSADVTIVANGPLLAGANGVLAFIRDAAATGDIDVRANGSVTGAVGINAQNAGSGRTTVTAVGPSRRLSGASSQRRMAVTSR